jgi:hypothetical protein
MQTVLIIILVAGCYSKGDDECSDSGDKADTANCDAIDTAEESTTLPEVGDCLHCESACYKVAYDTC